MNRQHFREIGLFEDLGSWQVVPAFFAPFIYLCEAIWGVDDMEWFLVRGILLLISCFCLSTKLVSAFKSLADFQYLVKIRSDAWQECGIPYDTTLWNRCGWGEYRYLFEGGDVPRRQIELVIHTLDKFRQAGIIGFFMFIVAFILGADLERTWVFFGLCCFMGMLFSGLLYVNATRFKLELEENIKTSK